MAAAHEEIQLSWLRAFLAVHDRGSFTAAAGQVHRAQSRVSSQVAQLERHLGVQLFVRGRLPTCLTEAGTEFLPYAQAVLHEIEAGAAAVNSRSGTIRGRVTVATYPGASALVLAPMIKRFCDRYPNALVDLRDVVGNEPAASVLHGDVDLAVRAADPPLKAHSLLLRPLFREPILCLMPTDLARGRTSVTPHVFAGTNVIMTGMPTTAAGLYSSLLADSRVQPARETVVGQPTTVAALVDAGVGLGILPALAAQLLDTDGRVRALQVEAPGWTREVVVLTHRSRRYPQVVETFIDDLLAAPIHPVLEPSV